MDINTLIQKGIIDENAREKDGYIFIRENLDILPTRNPLANKSIDNLICLQEHIDTIFDKTIPATTIDIPCAKPYFINLIRSNPRITKTETLDEINRMIELIMQEQYKIHLQPTDTNMEKTIIALSKLLTTDDYPIITFKFSIYQPSDLYQSFPQDTPPSIVVYPRLGHAKQVLTDILKITDAGWGSGVKPRGNIRVNDLVYYAGGDWNVKRKFPKLFDKNLILYKNQKDLL